MSDQPTATGPTPPPVDPANPPQAKPSAPAPEADPPGIATTIVKQDGQGPKPSDTAKRARIDEELDSLDELPSAAAEKA